jgi:hypothetical protein
LSSNQPLLPSLSNNQPLLPSLSNNQPVQQVNQPIILPSLSSNQPVQQVNQPVPPIVNSLYKKSFKSKVLDDFRKDIRQEYLCLKKIMKKRIATQLSRSNEKQFRYKHIKDPEISEHMSKVADDEFTNLFKKDKEFEEEGRNVIVTDDAVEFVINL